MVGVSKYISQNFVYITLVESFVQHYNSLLQSVFHDAFLF